MGSEGKGSPFSAQCVFPSRLLQTPAAAGRLVWKTTGEGDGQLRTKKKKKKRHYCED